MQFLIHQLRGYFWLKLESMQRIPLVAHPGICQEELWNLVRLRAMLHCVSLRRKQDCQIPPIFALLLGLLGPISDPVTKRRLVN